MNIPNFDLEKIVDDKGYLTPPAKAFFDQLITALQQNLSNEGYKLPQQPTSTITQLNTQQSIGALLYDSTANQLKININGTFKVVTVS